MAASPRMDANLLEAAVRDNPWVATAAAVGFGFLLGGGVPRRTLAILAKTSAGLVATWLSEELLQQLRAQRADSAEEEPR
jgi:hypothetical protein